LVERRTHTIKARRRSSPAADRPRGLPQVYRGGSRGGRNGSADFDRATGPAGGRFRWFVSTCLAAAVGAVAIVVVIFGSNDRIEPWPKAMERMAKDRGEAPLIARRVDGLRWSVPKADKLQVMSGAQTTRFIIHDTQKVKRPTANIFTQNPTSASSAGSPLFPTPMPTSSPRSTRSNSMPPSARPKPAPPALRPQGPTSMSKS